MRKKILAAFVLAVLLAGCLGLGSQPPKEEKTRPPGELRQATLQIDGMTCPACPETIKTALMQLKGVVDADISFEKHGGTVIYDARKITAGEISASKIFSWGVYTAEVVDDRALEEGR